MRHSRRLLVEGFIAIAHDRPVLLCSSGWSCRQLAPAPSPWDITMPIGAKLDEFVAEVIWTGNRGEGTKNYRGYDRTWRIATPGKAPIECSNDPKLGGDASKPNPEDLLLSSLSACHMLWYLHLASSAGIVVKGYEDTPMGVGETGPRGEGRFVRAVLRPRIAVARGADLAKANALHQEVHHFCFIARSVNFPISYEATYVEV
jgi:organic hydroperoxide reductase OsmC/OhrA